MSLQDFSEPEIHTEIETIRHSCAHIMAHAISKIWPDAQFGIGPTIENGFYYAVRLNHTLTPDDLVRIEEEMKKIVAHNAPFERLEWSVPEAIAYFQKQNQPFKVEIIENLRDLASATEVSAYREGDFLDLCRGPHVSHAGKVKVFKLLSIAGAYWRGDEKRQQLQRIYGTAFQKEAELKEHLFLLEEAKKRDHRKLGKELGLFSLHTEAAAMPFFHPKGARVYNRLVSFMRRLYTKYGYDEVITPEILDVSLWHKSGHYENYKDAMYFIEKDNRELAVKPMNCPCHAILFGSERRSYRELPMRLADFGRLHRFEKSGALSGITRVRSFCQDDAHIFCAPDQIEAEISGLIEMIQKVYALFGFTDMRFYLSTRPEKRVGAESLWDQAELALKNVLDNSKLPYTLNAGDGAFYGPKIDFNVSDALKRYHQLGTIQLDFNLPERFNLSVVGADNAEHRPVVIHRAVLGSLERFLGVYIEHCAGVFPFWLAPVQARVIGIKDSHTAYCRGFSEKLKSLGFFAELDDRNESMGLKTREAQKAKIPFSLVAGDKEIESRSFSVRKYGEATSVVMTQEEILRQFSDLQLIPERAIGF